MYKIDNRTSYNWCLKICLTLKIPLALIIIFLVWFQYRSVIESGSSIEILYSKLEEAEEKLKDCYHRQEREFQKFANSKPKIPQSKRLSMHRFTGSKLVHLDLKGAPPKMEYLLKLIPLFSSLGATGILMEYEDMFPYHGYIRLLSSENAYSYDEISSFLSTADKFNMEVIPLIQTLGHFEFVLKHNEFKHLRETPHYPNMPCPLKEQSQELVMKMIKQVLDLHPRIRRIHLGGDEVFNIRDCSKCVASNKTKEELFLHHLVPILKYVHRLRGNKVRPIIWDDMLRSWSIVSMKKLVPLTDIMIWGYVPNVENYPNFPSDMWEKYEKAFDHIWIASSYKGALSPNNNLVPILMHMQNHESWMRLVKKIRNRVVGVAITGWSRYDHFAAMCELLPVSLPSLALSLSIIDEGTYKQRSKDSLETKLGFSTPVIITKDIFGSWDTNIPNFPGGDVYSLVAELENHVSWYISTKNRLDSWASDRQVKENKVSILQLKGAENSLKQLIPSFNNFREKCFIVLGGYFFEDTVNEWVKDKVDSFIKLSEELFDRYRTIEKELKYNF